MRSRTSSTLVPLLLTLLAGSAGVASSSVVVELDRGLRAIEAGTPVPPANRPLDQSARLAAGLMGRDGAIAPVPFVAPSEFSVVFEYAGTRAALEAQGVRVVTQAGGWFTARVRRDEIGVLRSVAGLRNVRLARYTEPQLNQSMPDVRGDLEHAASGSPPVYAGRAGNGLIVGDVDTGIDFTRPDFGDGAGATRILDIWDQTDLAGPNPAGFAYGTEWTKADIDNTPGSV